MQSDTVSQFIVNLGKSDFDAVVQLIMTRVFEHSVVATDGKGDGGSDFKEYAGRNGTSTVAIQVTVQKTGWQAKAKKDAKTAVSRFKAKSFMFYTSQPRETAALRQLEQEISAELDIRASCFGSRELADFIIQRRLIIDFFEAIGQPLATANIAGRPDKREIYLHALLVFDDHGRDMRVAAIDDCLQFSVIDEGGIGLKRDQIVGRCADILGNNQKSIIESRFDSLLTRGVIIQSTSTGICALSEQSRQEMGAGIQMYKRNFTDLAAKCQSVAQKVDIAPIGHEQSEQLALILARLSLRAQFESADEERILNRLGLYKGLGDPKRDIEDMLAGLGISKIKRSKFVDEIQAFTVDDPLVIKMSRCAMLMAIDSIPTSTRSRIVGTKNWRDVTVFLDSSVAIPYICARLFGGGVNRYSNSAIGAVSSLIENGASVIIPGWYLDEMASHLVYAMSYVHLKEMKNDLSHSENGYVSYFFSSPSDKVPGSLVEFIKCISSRVTDNIATCKSAVMGDIEIKLKGYGVNFGRVPESPEHIRQTMESNYAYAEKELPARRKPPILLRHDIEVLCFMEQSRVKSGIDPLLLTWDRILGVLSRQHNEVGLIVTPNGFHEVIQTGMPLSDVKATNLGFVLSAIGTGAQEHIARFVDMIAKGCSAKSSDWEFIQKMVRARNAFAARIESEMDWNDFVSKEAHQFIESAKSG